MGAAMVRHAARHGRLISMTAHGTHGAMRHCDPSQVHIQKGHRNEQHRLARRRRRHHSRRTQLLRFPLIG